MQPTYYPGKIKFNKDGCYVGDQKIDCPQSSASRMTSTGDKLDILPAIKALDKRNDFVFTSIFLVAVLGLLIPAIFRIKIFGKTLGEYITPIWYFILVSILVVLWQYLFGLKIDDNLVALRISQWIWEAMVLVSAYKLSRLAGFGYGNMFFLGILYSLFIHGLKVSIRYFFYTKTLLYVLDRFIYGSLLVMVFAFVLGSVFVYFRRKGIK